MKLAPLGILAMFVAASLYGERVEASCTLEVNSGITTIGGGQSLLVDSDLPNGSTFRMVDTPPGDGDTFFTCTQSHEVQIESILNGAQDLIHDNVRELTLSDGKTGTGVGVRLKFTDANGQTTNVPSGKYSVIIPQSADWQAWPTTTHVEYVKLRDDIRYGQIGKPDDRIATTNILSKELFPNNGFFGMRRVRVGNLTLVAPTCTIDVGDLNQKVKLGDYTVSFFQDQAETPWENFGFKVTSCADANARFADITFGQGADADPNNNALFSMNQNGPSGLAIAIQTNNGTNVSMTPGATRQFAALGNDQSYAFRARLERTVGEVTPGEVARPVTVRITYR